MQGKAEDAGGLTPAKDDNAAMRTLYPRAFARNSDDCYRRCSKEPLNKSRKSAASSEKQGKPLSERA